MNRRSPNPTGLARAPRYLCSMLLRRLAFPDFCEPCLPKFVFGMAVVATLLVAAPAAHAACESPKNICKHFDDCLQRTSDSNTKDADGIRAGVNATQEFHFAAKRSHFHQ
jgi:demethoxyubiquinone hydroxylase (CLK1/Coq7/Cat5 family)